MKAYKVELLIIDVNEAGDRIKYFIEHANYHNDCIQPLVVKIESQDIGEWSDDHQLTRIFDEMNKAEPIPLGPTPTMIEAGACNCGMFYTVRACRWGSHETHSYIVGVFNEKMLALKSAEIEEDYRGGKYLCEVEEWPMNASLAGNHDWSAKVIKPLPPTNIDLLIEKNKQACGIGEPPCNT